MSMFKRVPPAALPQLYSDLMHLSAAVIVAGVAAALAWVSKIPADLTGAVFTGVIGYIAGQARTVARSVPSRSGDGNGATIPPQDAAG